MATLKDHQNAMVDLLANGSAIPASAARLAHALHDVLALMVERDSVPHSPFVGGPTATASHNDAKLAADLAMGLADGEPLLRAKLANVTNQRDTYKARCESLELDLEVTRAALKEVTDALASEGIDLTNLLLRARNK